MLYVGNGRRVTGADLPLAMGREIAYALCVLTADAPRTKTDATSEAHSGCARRVADALAAHGLLQCSFCGKGQQSVKRIITGPGVYICNECVDLCGSILADSTTHVERSTEET